MAFFADLIAEQRGMHSGQHPLLFQLLNEIDGLGEEVDVAFLLTTNRADTLEPALAARSGSVDQAIEIPLPDADERRAFLELYKGNLQLEIEGYGAVLDRIAAMTASFLKELLRRAAMVAVTDHHILGTPERLVVSDDQIQTALDELLNPDIQLARSPLGSIVDATHSANPADNE